MSEEQKEVSEPLDESKTGKPPKAVSKKKSAKKSVKKKSTPKKKPAKKSPQKKSKAKPNKKVAPKKSPKKSPKKKAKVVKHSKVFHKALLKPEKETKRVMNFKVSESEAKLYHKISERYTRGNLTALIRLALPAFHPKKSDLVSVRPSTRK